MLLALIQIIGYLIGIVTTVVIVQFVSNNFVASIWQALNMILDPFLKPIRRIMPDTGMIDFSPIVLIIGLRIIQMLLGGLYNDLYMSGPL
jgi:YggT family protein